MEQPARVRDAMVAEPRALDASASAQEAGAILARPEVRSVLVVKGEGRLLGEVTRELLVQQVVAAGRAPGAVQVGEIAVPVALVVEAGLDVEAGFALLERADAERAPVVDGGRLVGALSRSVLQRRLAEDDPPPPPES